MSDKDFDLMLKYLEPICKKLILIEAPILRSTKANDLNICAINIGFKNIIVANSIKDAISHISSSSTPTVICGSFFIMEEVVRCLKLESLFTN